MKAERSRRETVRSVVCPYSSETIAACRHYEPVSAHSDRPGAEMCRHVVVERQGPHTRKLMCARTA